MRTILLLFAISLISNNLFAQEFGKFSPEYLSQKTSKIDSSADKEYLLKQCTVSYEFSNQGTRLVLQYFDRIKIYTEEGIDAGNYEIPYELKEDLYYIKAKSYNLEGAETVEQKLKKKNIYKEKLNEDYNKKTFAIPNVKKGSIIEVMYSIRTPYVYVIPKFYFQEDVPIIRATYILDLPKYIGLNPVATGYLPLNKKESASPSTYHGEKRFTYSLENVPPIKADEYVLNINDYRTGLKFEIHSTSFPNSYTEYYSKDWEQIVTNLYERRSFGHQLDIRLKEYKSFIAEQKGKSEDDIIKACYEHVINNYSWDETTSILSTKGLPKTIKEKAGNSGDLNILLINLLNKCGINTHPYLTTQRKYGLFNQLYASLSSLNYLIACAEKTDGSLMFLDATNKDLKIGQLPMRATNIAGVVVKDKKPIIYEMANPNIYNSGSLITCDFNETNDKLIGTGKKVVRDYAAYRFKIKYEEKVNEDDLQEIEDEDFVIESEDQEEDQDDVRYIFDIQGLDDVNQDITFKIEETNSKSITKLDDKIYLESTLGYGLDENPFSQESRQFPIFYNYKIKLVQAIKLNIPEGYSIESMPEDMILAIPNRKVQFRHSFVRINDSSILVNILFQVTDPIILPEDYASFKHLFDLFLDRSNEKIVLKRN